MTLVVVPRRRQHGPGVRDAGRLSGAGVFAAQFVAYFNWTNLGLILQRYEPSAGIGTVVATMLPYSVAFVVVWTIMLVAWVPLGLPLEPGAGMYL